MTPKKNNVDRDTSIFSKARPGPTFSLILLSADWQVLCYSHHFQFASASILLGVTTAFYIRQFDFDSTNKFISNPTSKE